MRKPRALMTLIHCMPLTMITFAECLPQTDDAKHWHTNVAEWINFIITIAQ